MQINKILTKLTQGFTCRSLILFLILSINQTLAVEAKQEPKQIKLVSYNEFDEAISDFAIKDNGIVILTKMGVKNLDSQGNLINEIPLKNVEEIIATAKGDKVKSVSNKAVISSNGQYVALISILYERLQAKMYPLVFGEVKYVKIGKGIHTLWTRKLPTSAECLVSASGERVLLLYNASGEPGEPQDMFLLDKNGKEKFSYHALALDRVSMSKNGKYIIAMVSVTEEKRYKRKIVGFDIDHGTSWKMQIDEAPEWSISENGDAVILYPSQATLESFSKEGKSKWKHIFTSKKRINFKLAPDGNYVALVQEGRIVLFDNDNGSSLWERNILELAEVPPQFVEIYSLDISSSKKYISLAYYPFSKEKHIRTHVSIFTITGEKVWDGEFQEVVKSSFSDDGRFLVVNVGQTKFYTYELD